MWFIGSVTEAIKKARDNKSLLIVFIHDDTEDSKSMLSAWNSDWIQSICENNGCVALNFSVTTLEAKQFSEFYPVTKTPISFFIDNSGVSIDIVIEVLNENDLNERINKAVDAVKSKNLASNVATSSDVDHNQTAQKVEKIREKIKVSQEKKEIGELEEQKERELKRREDLKAMAATKEKIREMEMKAAAEERRQSKVKDREHLKRLKEQIEADRAERAEKYNTLKEGEKEEIERKRQERLQQVEAEKARLNELQAQSMQHTRINFRLADGQSLIETFESDRPFDDARRFVAGALDLRGQFALVQMYPRREFGSQDLLKSFRELQLTPSAVLMIIEEGKKRGSSVQVYQQNWFTSILALLTLPIVTIWNFLYSFIFPASSTNVQPVRQANNTNRSNDRGNVKRLNENRGSDPDDNATWNGNSTQQL